MLPLSSGASGRRTGPAGPFRFISPMQTASAASSRFVFFIPESLADCTPLGCSRPRFCGATPRVTDMTRTTNKPAAEQRPRYVPKFINGVHTVFDRHTWSHGRPLNTEKQARAVAADLNTGRGAR